MRWPPSPDWIYLVSALNSQTRPVTVYDHRGQAVSPKAINRIRMLSGEGNGIGGGIPYDSADIYGQHMANWQPYLWSPDTELNPNRDRIVSRVRDIVRNDGWASGAVTRVLDNAIGANYRPIPKPDYTWLQHETKNKGYDSTWASEFSQWAAARFRSWANDPGKWCDIERGLTFAQMQYLGFRHKIVDGDALAMMRWEKGRLGYGKAQYCTAVQMIDPDRLSNPFVQFDQMFMRGGVQIDEYGAACGYHIREAHQGDWYNAAKSLTWKYIPRETSWGRPIIIHDFDRDRAGQHRGVSILSPVLERMRMLLKYDKAELDAAVLNAIFGAYIESPFDHTMLQDAMGDAEILNGYQDARTGFHDKNNIRLNGVKMPILFPSEKINTVDAARPTGNFEGFEGAVLRNVASGLGLSAQQVSQNWGDVNYSSARAALLEAWKTMDRRKAAFTIGFSHPMYLAFLEEAFNSDDPPLPPGETLDFVMGKHSYGRARWIGPAKGWVDPVAEKEGAWLGMEIGLSTLENEAADQGEDYLENLDQLEIEAREYDKRGLARPSWMGASPRQLQNTPAADKPPGETAPGEAPKIPAPAKPSKEQT